MRICLVTPTYPQGGAASGVGSAVRTLAVGLMQAGHEVAVVALSRTAEHRQNDAGVPVHWTRQGQLHWYVHKLPLLGQILSLPLREIENSLSLWRRVRELHRQEPFDIIEGSETGSLFLPSLSGRSRVIVRLHGDEYTFRRYTPGASVSLTQRLSRWLQRWALRRADALISPSNSHLQEIKNELGHGAPPMTVIYHGLDPFWQAGIGQEAALVQNPLLLYVGRIEAGKGIFDLLRAFAQVVRDFPSARLAIAGGYHPSISPQEIERLIQELSLAASVDFLGQLSYTQLAQVYRQAQLLVFPSYYETFGLVALEAMACELPVIAYRAGALPEIVVEGETGLLVTPGDPHELAQAIVRLLDDSSLRHRMGLAGEQRAKQEFGIDRMVEQTLEVYQGLLRAENSRNV